MIGDQRRFSDLVVYSGTQFKARNVLRMSRRLFHRNEFAAEKLQPGSEKQTASESTETGKAKEVCAHNFHSYKNENTLGGGVLAIEIFRRLENFARTPGSQG